MENEMNAMMLAGLYLGLGFLILILGWGMFAFGVWIEEKIHARFLAKTRSFIKPRELEVWY